MTWLCRTSLPGRKQPQRPIGPAPAVPASEVSRLAPQMERSVIAPPPDLQPAQQKTLQAPEPAVIAPPPAVEAGSARRLGDLNIARSSVIAPAPQLSLDEQRAIPGRSSTALSRRSPEVIAPPPALGASGRSHSSGGMIALSLHPAVGAPPDPLAGNRRGNFAATPEGHRGASGAPGASHWTREREWKWIRKKQRPAFGIVCGQDLEPGVTGCRRSLSELQLLHRQSEPDRQARARRECRSVCNRGARTDFPKKNAAVFGNRKFYSLSLNMPNLNSAGGSWIVRFAALKAGFGPQRASFRRRS